MELGLQWHQLGQGQEIQGWRYSRVQLQSYGALCGEGEHRRLQELQRGQGWSRLPFRK
ncbi:hypothetical protein KSP39_PZI020564 [Platanthera zijinensis]|uniref:Uncharacterized protein n=1 Tax=Platanthera zijinensis TaxID=2320716 RepID=A0AAP0AZP0_9ASPA